MNSKSISSARLSCLVFFVFSILMAKAQFYVSTSGNDSNPGTIDSPFLTIQHAASILKAGDTCLIRQGEYREEIHPKNDGIYSSPIVYTACENEIVIISGTKLVRNWEKHSDYIYKTFWPDSVLQLMVNRKPAIEARYPDFIVNDMLSKSNWDSVYIDSSGNAFFYDMDFSENHWKGALCVVITGKEWVSHIGIVSGSNNNILSCKNRSKHWNSNHSENYLGKGIGFICRHLNALNQENEWHWQHDTLYLFSTQNIDRLVVEARSSYTGVHCGNRKNLVFNKLNFLNTALNFESSHNCKLENCRILYAVPMFSFEKAFNRMALPTDTSDFSIAHWEGCGIKISGTGNIIQNCYVGNSWGDGISLGGENNKIINCLIEECDWMATDAAPICMTGRGHVVERNTIRNTGRCGIVHNQSKQVTIRLNDVSDFGKLTNDLGGIYAYKTHASGSEIAWNWIHDNHAGLINTGIYVDINSSGMNFHHNVIWNCESGIRTNKPGRDFTIYNNTVLHCGLAQSTTGGANKPELINVKTVNNLSDKDWSTGTLLANNHYLNDLSIFSDNACRFSLPEKSSAIDAGINFPTLSLDFYGNAPDAGAYERGFPCWKPGCLSISEPLIEYLMDYEWHQEGRIPYTMSWKVTDSSMGFRLILPVNEFISVKILNATGEEVEAFETFQIGIWEKDIKITDFPEGIYLILIRNRNNCIQFKIRIDGKLLSYSVF